MRRQFTQERIVYQPAVQSYHHSNAGLQVCKIGVWVIFCFRQPQQVVGGYSVKLRQLDKGITADVLEIVHFIAAQGRLGEMCLLRKLFQRLATLHTQVF